MLKQKTQYYDPIVITFPDMVAKVYRPILTDEERTKRMRAIHTQAANLLKKEKHRERLDH